MMCQTVQELMLRAYVSGMTQVGGAAQCIKTQDNDLLSGRAVQPFRSVAVQGDRVKRPRRTVKYRALFDAESPSAFGFDAECGPDLVDRFAIVLGSNMSSLDRVVPQATQLNVLNRMVEMVVLGEADPTWLQHKIGFKNLRNVHYYIEAARWARLIDEREICATSLGRRYVSSRFDPRVFLEGLHGRAFFEEVMRVTAGSVPSPEVVESVLQRWSFRYSKSTITRRANDFCRLFGRLIEASANPQECQLVIQFASVEPQELLVVYRVAVLLPALQLRPFKGVRRSQKATADNTTQLHLSLKGDA